MKLMSKQDCDTCRHAPNRWTDEPCQSCDEKHSKYSEHTDPDEMDCVSREVREEKI